MAVTDNKGAEHLCSVVVQDQALMIDGTLAVFSQLLGRPAVEFFLARKALWSVGSCFRECAVLQKRRRWVPQCRQDPQRLVAPTAFPKPCQPGSEGQAAGSRRLDVVG